MTQRGEGCRGVHIRKCRVAVAAQIVGYSMLVVGVLMDGDIDHNDVRGVGIGTVMVSLMWFFVSRTRHDEARIYERGHQAGYDSGYIDGRRVAKPVVVRFPPTAIDRASHPLINSTSP